MPDYYTYERECNEIDEELFYSNLAEKEKEIKMKQQNNKENKLLKNVELASKIVLKEDEKLFKELGKEIGQQIRENIYT